MSSMSFEQFPLPALLPYLESKSIRRLRLVSKGFRQEIDNYLTWLKPRYLKVCFNPSCSLPENLSQSKSKADTFEHKPLWSCCSCWLKPNQDWLISFTASDSLAPRMPAIDIAPKHFMHLQTQCLHRLKKGRTEPERQRVERVP